MKLSARLNAMTLCAILSAIYSNTTIADQPAITVYNQDFAVVREKVHLDLQKGDNTVRFTDTTAHVEPDSVLLRDPTGRRRLAILEQNYRNDPISQDLLLSLYEGQTIDFQIGGGDKLTIQQGKIIRSGYVPHTEAWNQYGQQYYYRQAAITNSGGGTPIIEINGHLQFGLPGLPLFPGLKDDTVLKPTLHWRIAADTAGPLDAELAYVTGGMSWHADYNVIAPETGDLLELRGWVTIDNQSGRTFDSAKIKLMAGDVRKLPPPGTADYNNYRLFARSEVRGGLAGAPPVTEKTFDEYHLYTLARESTLRDRETKQVEFVSADSVQSSRIYVYDGAWIDPNRWNGYSWENIRNTPDYGIEAQPKVWVMREFRNSKENRLELPLPAGRVRFYRKDDDGRMEFVGEGDITHTPVNEKVRIYTGNAFDLVGERRRTDFAIDNDKRWCDERFEIKLRNHKKEPVEVRVVEHLYRWVNWELTEKSQDFEKKDAQTIEFKVTIEPEKEAVVTYKVHYSW